MAGPVMVPAVHECGQRLLAGIDQDAAGVLAEELRQLGLRLAPAALEGCVANGAPAGHRVAAEIEFQFPRASAAFANVSAHAIYPPCLVRFDLSVAQRVRRVIDAATVVFGVYPDTSESTGFGLHIIKGTRELQVAIAANESLQAVANAVPCTCLEQAMAAEQASPKACFPVMLHMSAFDPKRTLLIAARDSIAARDPKLPNR